MSDATERPWAFEDEGPPIVIEFDGEKRMEQAPPVIVSIRSSDEYPRIKTYIAQLLSRTGKEDAALIVKAVNAHGSLVEALGKARRDLRDYGAAPIQQVCEEMKRALDEAKP